MNGPILSIITVNFNNNLGLLKTLESVSSQSFSSYEQIIIDAGSTDGSRETIIQYEKENPHLSFWSSEPDKGIYDVILETIYLYIPLLTMNLMSREYSSGSIKLLY